MYESCTTKLVTKLVEETCSTDYHRILRCAEEGQIPAFRSRCAKIRCQSAQKKAQKLEMSTSRRKYVQIAGNSVSVELRENRFNTLTLLVPTSLSIVNHS